MVSAQRPKLSDPAMKDSPLQPTDDGRVRCSAWLGDVESALAEYGKVPDDVWIGKNSAADKVRWLARRSVGSDQAISRLNRENEDLRQLVSGLSQLVWEHHSSTIMRPSVCPACSDSKWSKLLDMARGAKSPNDKVSDASDAFAAPLG